MTPQEHKQEAERLLLEGVKIVRMISGANDERKALRRQYQGLQQDSLEARRLTERMDELGKKVMGIWAQAQVHATLSTGKLFSPSGEYR